MARMKRLETLYLHIGLEKTGTTTIQEFLEFNRKALADDGVFLPSVLGYKNHKKLAAYAFKPGDRDIAVTSSNVGETAEEVSAFRDQLADQLTEEVAAARARIGIISSEDLSRLFDPEEIQRVVDLLRPLCRKLKVVVFVRRQDLLAVSRYYSLVIGGSRDFGVFPETPDGPPRFYDFGRNIGRWVDIVGQKNVLLSRFPERPKAESFDSTRRFLEVVGIDGAGYTPVSDRHISLDAVNQIILQNYNVTQKSFDWNKTEALMTELAQYNDPRYRYIPGQKQARDFYGQYHAGNLALFDLLGLSDQMFSDDFSMYAAVNQRVPMQQLAIQRLLSLRGSGT